MLSKLYAGFLIVASLCSMVALGMLILVAITDVGHLVAPTDRYGMHR
jgi:hypothetical protein